MEITFGAAPEALKDMSVSFTNLLFVFNVQSILQLLKHSILVPCEECILKQSLNISTSRSRKVINNSLLAFFCSIHATFLRAC